MNLKSLLIAALLVLSPQLYANKICSISETQNALDLALMNKGYFVVSHDKKQSELLFTRFAKLYIDQDGYIRSSDNDYLLSVNKRSDYKQLKKIRVPKKNLAPKATSKINIGMNLPAAATDGREYQSNKIIYDSQGAQHIVNIKSIKIAPGNWKAQVFVDDVTRDEGVLTFNPAGELTKQEGLRHIQWPAEYGMHELSVNFKTSTQYGIPYTIYFMQADGYAVGMVVDLIITKDGEISFVYSNGQSRMYKNRIAVAMFTNPKYLEPVTQHLYKPSEKSGPPIIHWVNGEYSVLSGWLEDETCLVH